MGIIGRATNTLVIRALRRWITSLHISKEDIPAAYLGNRQSSFGEEFQVAMATKRWTAISCQLFLCRHVWDLLTIIIIILFVFVFYNNNCDADYNIGNNSDDIDNNDNDSNDYNNIGNDDDNDDAMKMMTIQ